MISIFSDKITKDLIATFYNLEKGEKSWKIKVVSFSLLVHWVQPIPFQELATWSQSHKPFTMAITDRCSLNIGFYWIKAIWTNKWFIGQWFYMNRIFCVQLPGTSGTVVFLSQILKHHNWLWRAKLKRRSPQKSCWLLISVFYSVKIFNKYLS